MQRPMDRRHFLVRAATALSGAAATLVVRPRRLRAAAPRLGNGFTPFDNGEPRSPDMTWYALDPEWGAGDPGCPVDPNAAHVVSGCHACNACHLHAANKLFATQAAADLHRAHAGCHCEVRVGGVLPDDMWTALFGDPDDLTYDAVDRRWDWVHDILVGEDNTPVCVTQGWGDQAFYRTWKRTDKPVIDGNIARTWMWSPSPYSCAIHEPYVESPGGQRLVQYFDKSRMEINDPNADQSVPWYVTNGLLVVELITGKRQVGNNSFENRSPADVNVAGDADDPTGPMYSSFADHLNSTVGFQETAITRVIHRDGSVSVDNSYASYGIGTAHFVEETQHWVATPFWEFMNSSGLVYDGDILENAALFEPWFYATGFPITEAFWATVKVAGTPRAVLMQCFERRVLTYTPGNPLGFETEAGNVGQHFWAWLYGGTPPAP